MFLIFMNQKSVQFYDFNTRQKDTKKYFCTYQGLETLSI